MFANSCFEPSIFNKISIAVKSLFFLTTLLLTAGCSNRDICSQERSAAATIRQLGGKVEADPSGKVLIVRLADIKVPSDKFNVLARLTNCQRLHLEVTGITDDGMQYLSKMTSLQSLSLYGNPISDAGLAHLANLTTITDLGINGVPIGDEGLVHLQSLTNLETLWIDKTKVTNAGLEKLSGLTKLKRLGLKQTPVTVEGIIFLKRHLPKTSIEFGE